VSAGLRISHAVQNGKNQRHQRLDEKAEVHRAAKPEAYHINKMLKKIFHFMYPLLIKISS
jgi:hypothetical protein